MEQPGNLADLNSIAATAASGYTGCSQESGFSATADGNNHLPNFSYDVSGNTLNDGSIAYTYDAESQIKTAAGVTYLYDGSGRRVAKSTGKLYWYGSGGEILAETDASGNTLNEYIFFGGKRIAMLPAGGSAQYYIEDLLGTSRVMTTNTGSLCYDADFYPYGGERTYTNSCPTANNYKFEGKERDTETGNDDFGARYYSNRFGRWLSADWSNVPAPVPYANLTNPQTLNLYAMVSDDPETSADLDGHLRLASQGLQAPQGIDPGTGQLGADELTCSWSADSCESTGEQRAEEQQLAQEQAAAQQQRQQAQNTNEQTRADIAATAEKYNGSPDWAFAAKKGSFACDTNKCNEFVGDVTKEAGAPVSVTGSDGKQRYPLAAELADPNTKISNWRVLGPNEKPQSGDIAAYKLPGHGISYSGHSGIVTSVDRNGTVHALAAHENIVGPDNKFQPSKTVVYRRYTGDQ